MKKTFSIFSLLAIFAASVFAAPPANVQTDGAGGPLLNNFSTGTKTITVSAGGTINASAGTLTLADDQIPVAKVDGAATSADLAGKANLAGGNTLTGAQVIDSGGTLDYTGTGTINAKVLQGTTPTAAGLALLDDASATAQRTTLGLGNVDNTSDANKPVSTATQTALDEKENGDSRVIYAASHWDDLSDFTVVGTSPTVVDGAIRFSLALGGAGFSGQALEIPDFASADETASCEIIFRAVSVNASSFGMAVGKKSFNGWNESSSSVQFNAEGANAPINIWPQASDAVGSTSFARASSFTVANGDLLRGVFKQRGNRLFVTYENITQGIIDSFYYEYDLGIGTAVYAPNSARFRIIGLGGTFDLLSINVTSGQVQRPDIIIVGDSKSFGSNSVDLSLRYGSLLGSLGSVAVMAGGADRTVEAVIAKEYIASFRPKYAVMCIGRNDLASAVSSGVYQANYAALVSELEAAGATVIHLLPIPETVQDQSALKSWIQSTYSGDPMVDVSADWNNSIHLSSDNVHPNEAGHRLIASAIIASGYVTPSPRNGLNSVPESGKGLSASQVSAAASGGLSGKSVSAQLVELDTEKAPKNSPTFTSEVKIQPSAGTWALAQTISSASDTSSGFATTPSGTISASNPVWFIAHRFSAQGPLSIWRFDGSSHLANDVEVRTTGLYSANGFIGNASTTTALATARTINGESFDGTANITVPGKSVPVTVGTLPVSPAAGDWAAVTDALAPTYGATVVGGGAIVTPVWYDGTNWTCR